MHHSDTSAAQVGIVRRFQFSLPHFKRVGWLSFFFVLKLLLDMSALAVVNIPMYGVLKSSTTPCVMVLDYCLRGKTTSGRVQLAVLVITAGPHPSHHKKNYIFVSCYGYFREELALFPYPPSTPSPSHHGCVREGALNWRRFLVRLVPPTPHSIRVGR